MRFNTGRFLSGVLVVLEVAGLLLVLLFVPASGGSAQRGTTSPSPTPCPS